MSRRPPKIRADALADYRESISDDLLSVLTLADDDCPANVRGRVSTGSLELDLLLGGGWPMGRVSENVGPEHVGKTLIMDQSFAQVQRMGGVAILAEPETARDRAFSSALGVDLKKLQYLRFPPREFTLERIFDAFMRTIDWWSREQPDTPVLLGLDALGGAAMQAEVQSGLGPQQAKKHKVKGGEEEKPEVARSRDSPGEAAKFLHKMARQISPRLANTKIALLVNNHEYQKIQTGGGRRAGAHSESYGGRAIRHLASIRLRMYPAAGEWLEYQGRRVGRVVIVNLGKNRLGNPWGSARLAIVSGRGIDNLWTIYEGLRGQKVITQAGSWSALSLDGQELKFQGWAGLTALAEQDPTLFPRLSSVYSVARAAELSAPQAGPTAGPAGVEEDEED